ncbi:MAG: prolipoprotein diacylglyceryl transferase [Oligoflexia bacterium]|nr:prolipoprotein diacylglyceryl transferase [Oligoflexia bacterium]
MKPVLLNLFGIDLDSYGLFLALSYLSALVFLKVYTKNSDKYSWKNVVDLVLIAIISGIIGGRCLFVITNFSYFSANPKLIFFVWNGGLVFLGGFIFGSISVFYYLRKKRLKIGAHLDLLAMALCLGHSIGRIGCFFAGCCHGNSCDLPWAVILNSNQVDFFYRGLPIHPTQIYESLLLFFLFIFLILIHKKKSTDGLVSVLYVFIYSIIRFILEYFRGDGIRGYIVENYLSTSQLISIFLFLGSGFLLVRILLKSKTNKPSS